MDRGMKSSQENIITNPTWPLTSTKETLIKSVRGECFLYAPIDTPRWALNSGRTGNVSNHVFGLNQRFPKLKLSNTDTHA